MGGSPVENEIEAATVFGSDARSSGGRQPLLRHNPAIRANRFARDAYPRLFEGIPPARQGTCTRAGGQMVTVSVDVLAAPVCAHVAPASVASER